MRIRYKESRFDGWTTRDNSPPPPVALQVCHEWRAETLKHYVLSFGTARFPASTYFNHDIDTLCFSDGIDGAHLVNGVVFPPMDFLLSLWLGRELVQREPRAIPTGVVRSLAFDADEGVFSRSASSWQAVRGFQGLENVLLIAWDEEHRADELMGRLGQTLRMVADAHPEWVVPSIEVVSGKGVRWGRLHP